MASGRQPPHHRLMQSFECPDLPDLHPGIVREPWSIQWGDIVVQLTKLTSVDTVVNRLSPSSADSLLDPTDNHLPNISSLSQSLDSSPMDSEDNSLDTLLPELPKEMEPVQMMNQILTQLTTKALTEIHPVAFAGTAAENIAGLKVLTELQHTMSGMIRNSCK